MQPIAACLDALIEDPALPGAWNNLGLRYFERGRLGEAIAALSRALHLQPINPGTASNLGSAYQYRGELGAAVEAFRRALSQAPQNAGIHINLGNVLLEQGRVDEAITAYQTALCLAPDLGRAEMNLAGATLYLPSGTLGDILVHARRWSRSSTARPAPPASRVRSERPKLGVISADFRQHAVGYLTAPALEGLARAGYELTCYSNSVREDAVTARFKASASHWRDVAGLDDTRLDALIRADDIDILIDLSGFSAGNRMAALARKPAPVQIASWVGYPATTGLPAMDYILADRHQVPPGAERYYSERVIRLPDSYVCFEPPPDAPEIGESQSGLFTFGSFNGLKKINPQAVALWSRILRAAPDSRLLMKAQGLDCTTTRQRFVDLFGANGIAAKRLQFVGGTSPAEHLDWMRRADLALDPFPYSGGRTTLEALWMGLPVVTLPTESFAGRHSLGYLQTLGLSEWVARDTDHYVELAVSLARDPTSLALWRGCLRERMLASPLADTARFTNDLDSALTTIWRQL